MSDHIDGRKPDRDEVLAQLMALECDLSDADGFGLFIDRRALLLAQLDGIKEPWTQSQKASLQQALVHGAEVLAQAQLQRLYLAKKIDQLRGVKRAHKGYSSTAPARFKKQF